MKRSTTAARTVVAFGLLALTLPDARTAGATQSAADKRAFSRALVRHVPVLRFDSGEDFFPLRVSAITNNVGNRLVRENGAEIAERRPDGRGLNSRYLRRPTRPYPNGDAIRSGDRVDERGGDPDDHIRADARRLQNNPRFGDRVYGRLVYVREGDEIVGAWLQYWFFYYHNDFPRLDAGDHEGDWEMVQVRLNADAEPIRATYSQHTGESKCRWSSVEKRRSRPVVYVALGSHASYFRAGGHRQDRDNDGEQTRRIRGLTRIGSKSPEWLNWPGHFGHSGPEGPKIQGGDKWHDPERFDARADWDGDCD